MTKADVVDAAALLGHRRPSLALYGRRLLAEGDSWFTLGSLHLPQASNLLLEAEFGTSTAIVSCARPGDTLQHMVDSVHDVHFDRLLRQPGFASYWDALLISAGGNDLIDAAQVSPTLGSGALRPPSERLLLTAAEVAGLDPAAGPTRYVSEPGWTRLANYLRTNFELLVQRRDQGPSRGRPVLLHTYSVPVARPAGARTHTRAWLLPALQAYGIPAADLQGVAAHLFERLRVLLLALDGFGGDARALPHVRVFDSAARVPLEPARPDARGNSGDWINEIHPNRRGYVKLGRAFGAWIEAVLAQYP